MKTYLASLSNHEVPSGCCCQRNMVLCGSDRSCQPVIETAPEDVTSHEEPLDNVTESGSEPGKTYLAPAPHMSRCGRPDCYAGFVFHPATDHETYHISEPCECMRDVYSEPVIEQEASA